MTGAIGAIIVTFLVPLMLVVYNRQRVKGRMLCVIVRKDKSVLFQLCQLRGDFVIFADRAYDVYPDFVRVARFPMGWPGVLQELVPASLYDEEDAIPLDWVRLDKRLERAMTLRAALDENWVRKLVQETASEAGGKFNWRKILPIAAIGVGVILLIVVVSRGGCHIPGIGGG